eukprot:8142427-Pyramimonas_sp.AAC.2
MSLGILAPFSAQSLGRGHGRNALRVKREDSISVTTLHSCRTFTAPVPTRRVSSVTTTCSFVSAPCPLTPAASSPLVASISLSSFADSRVGWPLTEA